MLVRCLGAHGGKETDGVGAGSFIRPIDEGGEGDHHDAVEEEA
jgi:hypothetical protein